MTHHLASRVPSRRAAIGFGLLAAGTWCLIVLGALVRAHGAGLACPDWPLCFGAAVPQFDLKVAFEWSHRVLAAAISLGLAALTLWLFRSGLRRIAGARLWLAWGLLATQVVLGGLTVLLKLAPWTVTAHLLVGNAFCATLVWIALDLRERPAERAPIARATTGVIALVAFGVVAQLALGGLVSSQYAGLACASFPTCDGTSFAPTLSGPVGLHVLHRSLAYVLVALVLGLVWITRGTPEARLAQTLLALVAVQVTLGVANVLLRLPVEITGLHSALASALVLTTAVLVRGVALAPRRSAVVREVGRDLGAPKAAAR